jgi:hypothetical protein
VISLRAFIAEMRASGALGRCCKQQKEGRLEDALETARGGLEILRPHGSNAWTGASQAILTVHVESLAQRLGARGASAADLSSAIDFLKLYGAEGNCDEYLAWIPYMEARLVLERAA